MKISLLTIVRGRQAAIMNMIEGLKMGWQLPDEMVIVHMNEDIFGINESAFPILEYSLHVDHQLPLAEARNYAASLAHCDHLIFLDADCIPDQQFVQQYDLAFQQNAELISGRVQYLNQAAMLMPDLLFRMQESSYPDPVRANIDQYPYALFWSLNFGCSKSIFNKIGRFDETFKGYGGEDTDFGFSARQQNVAFYTINAMAYHQYHPSYDPPLNHLEAIVNNANQFYKKWGIWPMEGWIKKFKNMGFIDVSDQEIAITRLPTSNDLEQVLKAT